VNIMVLLAFAWACGGHGRHLRHVTAADAAARALEKAEGRILVRYNPPQCECAPFELRTDEGWVRADFTEADDQEALDALVARAEADGARGLLAEYRVLASLVSSAPSYCRNRVPFASLRLETE